MHGVDRRGEPQNRLHDRYQHRIGLGGPRETVEAMPPTLGPVWARTGNLQTLPLQRMKAGREKWVQLSNKAVQLLKPLPRDGKFVFQGSRHGRPLSNMAI